MPILNITGPSEQRSLFFKTGASLREILDVTDIRVRSGCRGSGSCGLCQVLIEEGTVNAPSTNERLLLTQEMDQQGIRLACQVFPKENLSIRIINVAPKSDWRSLSADAYFEPLSNFHLRNRQLKSTPDSPGDPDTQRPSGLPRVPGVPDALGLAVDLGTTHISATLWDMAEGKRLTGRTGLNQQLLFGSDVMTRIVAATESRERSHEISQLAIESIAQAILDICSREGYDSRRISRVSIVGNTPELALLSEKNYDLLLQPKFWTKEIDCEPVDTRPWCNTWNISQDAVVDVVSPLAGFVGSDLLAGIIATEMGKNSRASLLIDFGTNTEIALWDGATLWATSAAGGPAFEGSGVSCGMPAAPGGIYQISQLNQNSMAHDRGIAYDNSINHDNDIDHDNSINHNIDFQVIAGDAPKGICGSGLVDLMALLLNAGVINTKGKFTTAAALTNGSFVIHKSHDPIAINSRDIDVLQRAKAAIGAGIQCLLHSAGIPAKKLEHIYVCGVFGRFLNIRNAQQIGLLPQISETAIQLCGNTALAGCEMVLISPDVEQELIALRKKSRIINMSNYADFDNLFIDNLYLRPLEVD